MSLSPCSPRHRRSLATGAVLVIACAFGAACHESGPPPAANPGRGAVPSSSASASAKASSSGARPRFAPREDRSALPRAALWGNPSRQAPKLSPDGTKLAFLAPDEGVMNVWLGPSEQIAEARPLTHDRIRGIRSYAFAPSGTHVLYLQDAKGNENWHVYAVEIASGKVTELTPGENVRASITALSRKKPHSVVVSSNERDPEVTDLYEIDIRTGTSRRVFENKGRFVGFDIDEELIPRVASRVTESGTKEYLWIEKDGSTKPFFEVSVEDQLTTTTEGFDESGKTLYITDSRKRNTSALVAYDIASGKTTVLVEDPKADVKMVLRHPMTKRPVAAVTDPGRWEWHPIDPDFKADFARIVAREHEDRAARGLGDRDIEIPSRSLDDKRWIVQLDADDGPTSYVLFDRQTKKQTPLFVDRPDLERLKLTKMQLVHVPSRDGLDLPGYLSLPRGTPETPATPLPMVLWVHGGPWSRDEWGRHPVFQLLASRGYAVLSVNFRGSTGFGKAFVNAANREWSGKMQDDLVDAVKWAIDKKIADPTRIGIFGASYGGYASLVGLTKTPDLFACGIDVVGISNIVTWLDTFPPYWKPMMGQIRARVGDPSTEAGKRDLLDRSPLTHASKITKPLLVVQGKNDPRVKPAESEQLVKAASAAAPVTYVVYDDEGHGFARPESWISFNAMMEVFFAQCLGGTYEPWGNAMKGANLHVMSGAEHIAGLSEVAPR